MPGDQCKKETPSSVSPVNAQAPFYMKPAFRWVVLICIVLIAAIGVGVFAAASNDSEAEEPSDGRHVNPHAEGFSVWNSSVYTDKFNPTVHALSGLAGWQLQDLMLMLGFEWDDSANEWQAEGCRVFVCNADRANLDFKEVHALSKKSSENTVVYTIETSEFGSLEDAYAGLVSEVMDNEDSARISDDTIIGIAQNTWDEMVLITVHKMEEPDMVRLQVFTEPSIATGCFDTLFNAGSAASKDTYGSSAADVFQMLTGRVPELA